MPTLLTNRRMPAELRARVEASVGGRTASRVKPARFRAIVRMLFAISVVATVVWTFAHNRVAARELERRRATLELALRTQSRSLTPHDRAAIAADEGLLRAFAETYAGDVAAIDFAVPGALAAPMVWVRGPVDAFASGPATQKTAMASIDEAFVRCLFDPPRSRRERDVLDKTRAAYAATAPLPNVYRLAEAYTADLLLAPQFEARVASADERELGVLEHRVERARLGEVKKALAAILLLAIFDEPGDPKVAADLDGERPHDVRVEIVDLQSSKVLLRSRKHVDPSAWSATSRAEWASGMDSCALAFDVRQVPR